MQSAFPGKFFYADSSAFSFSNADLKASVDGPGGDRIHPSTDAGRQAIANLAFYTSIVYGGLKP